MTTPHPSYGILTPEEFAHALAQPYGGAQRIINRKDPLWGLTAGSSSDLKKFTVQVRAVAQITQTRTKQFDVFARDEDHAAKQAEAQASNHDFDFDQDVEDIDYEIDDVEECS